jgi:hypothetical protein
MTNDTAHPQRAELGAYRSGDALPPALHREAVQDAAVQMMGWSTLIAAAAEHAPAAELLGMLRKMRASLLFAVEEVKALEAVEEGSGE